MAGNENQNAQVKDEVSDENYALLMEREWNYPPHLTRKTTLLRFFMEEKNLKNLVQRLKHKSQVMNILNTLFDSLKRAHHLLESLKKSHDDVTCLKVIAFFDDKAKELFNCPEFSYAFSDLYYEEEELYSIVSYLVMYKNERQPRERMMRLMNDPFIDIFVEETAILHKARVVLSVLFGCWIDEAICRKLARSIIDDERFQQLFMLDTDFSDTDQEDYAEDTSSPKGMQTTEKVISEEELEDIYPPLDILRPTRSECIYNRKYSKVLAEQVNYHEELKSMIDDIVHSLRYASTDGDGPKVNQLFSCSNFIKACVETCRQEGCYTLIYDIDIYKTEQTPDNRIKFVSEDVFFKKFVLGSNENLDMTRRVLSVLLSYWSDEDLHRNVGRGVLKLKDNRLSLNVSTRPLKINGVKVSTSIELENIYRMRKANKSKDRLNASDAEDSLSSKRIHDTEDVLDAKDTSDLKGATEEIDMLARDGFLKPHEILDRTITECIYYRKYSEVLALEVNKHRHLTSMIDEIMSSLRKCCKDGDGLHYFNLKLKQLFNCSDFKDSCVETCFQVNSSCLVYDIEVYKNEQTTENQIKVLLEDVFFKKFVLVANERLTITRGALSVLLGYWSDYALHRNVCGLLSDYKRKRQSLDGQTGRVKIKGFKVSPTIEGLKEAMILSFPMDEAKRMCEQIERHKFEFKLKLLYREKHWISGLEIVWFGKEFKISGLSMTNEPYYWE